MDQIDENVGKCREMYEMYEMCENGWKWMKMDEMMGRGKERKW